MNNAELYIEQYKQLEQFALRRYGFPEDGKAVYRLSRRPEFASFRAELDYCREVRGFLQHKPRLGGSFAVVPSDEMIAFLKATIDKVVNPPRAKDVAIPITAILHKSMDDLVLPAMMEMQKKLFTHVPILQNGVVIGVFSESTLFSYLADERIVEIAENMRFSDLAGYLPLEKHRAESFRFVKTSKPISEIRAMFEQALAKQDHIGLVFTTPSGKPGEPLCGILTAWDVAAAP